MRRKAGAKSQQYRTEAKETSSKEAEEGEQKRESEGRQN